MKKIKPLITKNADELASLLGLNAIEGKLIKMRVDIQTQILKQMHNKKITHLELAHKLGTSRPRITSLVNMKIDHVSTDFLLKTLMTLGVEPEIKYKNITFKSLTKKTTTLSL